jgi:hypothetical protein
MMHTAYDFLKDAARRIEHPCVERADAAYDYVELTATTQAGRITLSIAFKTGVSQEGLNLVALVQGIEARLKQMLNPPTLVSERLCGSGRQVLSQFHATWEFGPESKKPTLPATRAIGWETVPGTPPYYGVGVIWTKY